MSIILPVPTGLIDVVVPHSRGEYSRQVEEEDYEGCPDNDKSILVHTGDGISKNTHGKRKQEAHVKGENG